MGGWLSSISAWISGKRQVRVLIVGLDGAGKTTILYRLQLNQLVKQIAPTIAFNLETVEVGNLKLQVWDLGGQIQLRPYWRLYFKETAGIVFVIDSADRARIATCGEELAQLLREEELERVPLIILANKQDLPDAMRPDEISQQLALSQIQNRSWTILATSATDGNGVREGFDWLSERIEAGKR
jgi:small GTP-binding protein